MFCDDLKGRNQEEVVGGGPRGRDVGMLTADSSHFTGETTKHCKAIILQLKIHGRFSHYGMSDSLQPHGQ